MGPFFDSSRDVAMATNFGQIWQTKFRSAPWHFEMDLEYHNVDERLCSTNDPSASCTNLVN